MGQADDPRDEQSLLRSDVKVRHGTVRVADVGSADARRHSAVMIDVKEPGVHDWLAECLGFAVEYHGRRIGLLDDVQHDPESGQPLELVVRAPRMGRRRALIAAEYVAAILPGESLIILREPWSSAEVGNPEVWRSRSVSAA
jgi:hypothetical protein